jgi:hypothetical protein
MRFEFESKQKKRKQPNDKFSRITKAQILVIFTVQKKKTKRGNSPS